MNELTSIFLQSELSYRTDRIKGAVSARDRRKDGRVARVRRLASFTR